MKMYMKTADILKALDRGDSVKKAVFNADLGKFIGPVYKMGLRIQKHKPLLEEILSFYAKSAEIRNRNLMLVLIYELFLGAGKIRGGGSLKRSLTSQASVIEAKYGNKLKKLREECNKEELERIM